MSPRSLLSSIILAGVAATFFTAPNTARAQGLIDFLWGGSTEWGGERQIVSFDPKYTPGQLIVSFGDRRLYLITHRGRAISYPIAVPREKSRWQGRTTISNKRVNPSWRPTAEMLEENPKLPSWVPGGHPMNPLGVRALYLGASAYRIHGTDAPWTIGQAVSQGCIRMYNKDVLDLYPRVPVGTRVTVTWARFAAQSVAESYEDQRYGLDAPDERHTIRNLPPLPRKSHQDTETAGLPRDFISQDDEPAAKKTAAKKKKVTTETEDSKPAKTSKKAKKPETADEAETDTAHVAAAPDGATSAVEVAQRAAAAAAKAAKAAREAADAAKKAAADAKKATAKSAAL